MGSEASLRPARSPSPMSISCTSPRLPSYPTLRTKTCTSRSDRLVAGLQRDGERSQLAPGPFSFADVNKLHFPPLAIVPKAADEDLHLQIGPTGSRIAA